VNWADLLHSLGTVDVGLVWAAVALLGGTLLARALRWHALLAPLAHTPLSDAFSYNVIGYLINNVLPFRLGEAIRAGLLGEKLRASKTSVFATVVVERVLDVLSLLVLVAVLLVTLDLPSVVQGSVLLGEAIAAVAALALCLLAWQGEDVSRLIPRFMPEVMRARLLALLAGFVQGLQVLRSGRQILACLVWSTLSWGLFSASVTLFLHASGLGELPWQAPLLVVVVTSLGSAIPSSPGFVGGYHFLAVFSLSFWSVARGDALSFAILVYGINYVVVTGLGALALWRENIAFRQLRWRVRAQRGDVVQNDSG
jgi:uncharacterized protein (TIRG00374 family)